MERPPWQLQIRYTKRTRLGSHHVVGEANTRGNYILFPLQDSGYSSLALPRLMVIITTALTRDHAVRLEARQNNGELQLH
jgi:hypothetical protein